MFPCTIPENLHVPPSSTWSVCDSSEMKQQKGGNFLPGKQLPGKFLRLRFFPRPLTYIACQEGHAFCIPRFLVTGRAPPSRDYMKGKEAITIQLGPSPTEPLLPQQLSPHGFFHFIFLFFLDQIMSKATCLFGKGMLYKFISGMISVKGSVQC